MPEGNQALAKVAHVEPAVFEERLFLPVERGSRVSDGEQLVVVEPVARVAECNVEPAAQIKVSLSVRWILPVSFLQAAPFEALRLVFLLRLGEALLKSGAIHLEKLRLALQLLYLQPSGLGEDEELFSAADEALLTWNDAGRVNPPLEPEGRLSRDLEVFVEGDLSARY